jgi:hypothetical protein
MLTKNTGDLRFLRPSQPMLTVEVDLDSFPSPHSSYGWLVSNALVSLAARNPDLVSTIYVLESPSINFLQPGYSAFFGIAGPKSVRETLYAMFSALRGLKVRYSDYITPEQGTCQYHIEDGRLWCPNDYLTWYAEEFEEMTLPVMGTSEGEEDEGDEEDEEDETWSDNPAAEVATEPAGPVASRYRAARSDASIATIRRTIESVFGLPEGSVALKGPDKKNLRGDAIVGTLRKRWEQ